MAKAEKKISSAFIYFFGSFGGILFGYDIGVMTGALPFLQADWHLENAASLVGWITSAVMFGAIFGGALAGQLSDKFGRRKMILMSAIVFMVFSVLSGVSPDMGEASAYYLIIVRMLLGLAVGAASALVPAYMSEMAPAKARGRLSGLNQTMIVSGMLLSYVVDFLLKDLPGEWAWRLMLGLAAVPALILFLGVLRLPESPRFLLRKGDEAQARKVLSYIRKNPAEIDQELASIKETAKEERQANQKTSWSTLIQWQVSLPSYCWGWGCSLPTIPRCKRDLLLHSINCSKGNWPSCIFKLNVANCSRGYLGCWFPGLHVDC